jgi:hypothetical protein
LYYSIGTKQAQVPYSIILSSVRVSRALRPFAYPVNPAAHIDALTNCLDTQISKT